MAVASITSNDRLSFTLFLAVSLHAAVILGVGFSADRPQPPGPTIEVTLSRYSDLEAPDDADFIAETNQQGSGDADEVLETTTLTETDFHANEPVRTMPEPLPVPEPATRLQRELLSSEAAAEEQVTPEAQVPVESMAAILDNREFTYDDMAREIASLEARISAEQQAEARRPRVKRLTSVSTKTATEAAYLNSWRQRVERIGNANYPDASVYGNLRMLVIVRFDGSLKEVRLLESSGHRTLDEAALRIVRMAAPYPHFPVEMRKLYDQLEIIRTWQFSPTGARLGS